MALQFTRNANVYIELTTPSPNLVWKVPVLDGFSFTQAINASEITINEAGDVSRRARLLFNDNLAPVEWSFSTYARPFVSSGAGTGGAYETADVHAVEEILWAMFVGADTFTTGVSNEEWSSSFSTVSPNNANATDGTSNTFNLNQSNVSKFSDNFKIYFSFEDSGNVQVYEITQAVVNSATIDFDIDGIATIQWSGFGKQVIDQASLSITPDYSEAITDTGNFIRNRISTVGLEWAQALEHSPNPDVYDIVLTGGSITLENNINFLVPEELGTVNVPLANVTGARSISGNLTCYLDNDTANSKSGELFADLLANTTTVRNVFNMEVNVGGTASGPRLTFDLPSAHLEVPVVNVEDLLTLDVTFHGQVSSGNVDNTDEATIIYRA
jgi:hypothetical protein